MADPCSADTATKSDEPVAPTRKPAPEHIANGDGSECFPPVARGKQMSRTRKCGGADATRCVGSRP